MRVLGIDTHGTTGGVAVIEDGKTLFETLMGVEATHSEYLVSYIKSALDYLPDKKVDTIRGNRVKEDKTEHKPYALEGIAVAIGPGSFTGLRIGVTIAKALSYAWNLPLVGVSTLQALAFQVSSVATLKAPMIYARRNRVYAALYKTSDTNDIFPHDWHELLPPKIYSIEGFVNSLVELTQTSRVVVTGDGVKYAQEMLDTSLQGRWVNPGPVFTVLHSSSVAYLGEQMLKTGISDDPYRLVPEYMRESEAELRWQK